MAIGSLFSHKRAHTTDPQEAERKSTSKKHVLKGFNTAQTCVPLGEDARRGRRPGLWHLRGDAGEPWPRPAPRGPSTHRHPWPHLLRNVKRTVTLLWRPRVRGWLAALSCVSDAEREARKAQTSDGGGALWGAQPPLATARGRAVAPALATPVGLGSGSTCWKQKREQSRCFISCVCSPAAGTSREQGPETPRPPAATHGRP